MNNFDFDKMHTPVVQRPSFIAKLAAALLAFMYVGSPIDVIPDVMPILGQVDDLAVLYYTYRYITMTGSNSQTDKLL